MSKWYTNFLSHDDQNLRAEEYEPNISFARARRTLLQQIVKYGNVIYNGDAKNCINIKAAPVREKKIKTDVHEYRVRLKYPKIVHATNRTIGTETIAYKASTGSQWSGTGTKWEGQKVPGAAGDYGIIYLGEYTQGTLTNLKEAKCVPENSVLTNSKTCENYIVKDFDVEHNAVLIQRAGSNEPGALPGTVARGANPANGDVLCVGTTGLYEDDWASNNAGMEKTVKYQNYVQFFDVIYGQSISADHIVFQGGDPRKAMDTFWNEILGDKIENAMAFGQGKYVEDPEDEGNRQQFMQGLCPALCGESWNDNNRLFDAADGDVFDYDLVNGFLDKINDKDNSLAPVLVSSRFMRKINKMVRDKVRTDFEKTAAGVQILHWRSDIGYQPFIYYPYLDTPMNCVKCYKKDGVTTTVSHVDAIKYDMGKYARLCKLVPLTVRPDIGKNQARTTQEKWVFTAITAEWGHPELGGCLLGLPDA